MHAGEDADTHDLCVAVIIMRVVYESVKVKCLSRGQMHTLTAKQPHNGNHTKRIIQNEDVDEMRTKHDRAPLRSNNFLPELPERRLYADPRLKVDHRTYSKRKSTVCAFNRYRGESCLCVTV